MIKQSVSPLRIIADHFGTLVDESDTRGAEPRVSPRDIGFHVVGPLLFALAAAITGVKLTTSGANLLITALSVFVGLLFNVLVLATTLKVAEPGNIRNRPSRRLSRAVLYNVEYAICAAFVCIVALLPLTFVCANCVANGASRVSYLTVITPVVVALLASFVFTLLLVINRMHAASTAHFDALDDEASKVSGDQGDVSGGPVELTVDAVAELPVVETPHTSHSPR